MRPSQAVRQRPAFQVLHEEKRGAALLAYVIQRTNVRMIELRDRPRLAIEPLTESRVAGKLRRENLDGNDAIETSVASFLDLAHPSRTEEGDDFIRTESRASGQGHLDRRIIRFVSQRSDAI